MTLKQEIAMLKEVNEMPYSRYDAIIRIRVSEAEKALIKDKSLSLNMSVSKYIREITVKGKIYDYSELRKLKTQINRIGCNINQTVKLMNLYLSSTGIDYNYLVHEFEQVKKMINSYAKNL